MWLFPSDQYVYNGRSGSLTRMDPDSIAFLKRTLPEAVRSHGEVDVEGVGIFSRERHENQSPELAGDRNQYRHIVVVLTEQCNMGCSYCPFPADPNRDHRPQGTRHSAESIAAISEYLISNVSSYTSMSFYGGEPLYRFGDMSAVVSNIKKRRPDWLGRFSFTTNLTVFSDVVIKFIVEHEPVILVSLDGPEATHDSNRPTLKGGPTHATVLKNLKKLQSLAGDYCTRRLAINSVIYSENFDEIDAYFAENFADLPLIRFSVAQETRFGGPDKNKTARIRDKLEVWATERANKISCLEDIKRSPLLLDFLRKQFDPIFSRHNVSGESKRFSSCAPGTKLVINSDLTFGVCEKTQEMRQGDLKTGFTGCDQYALEFEGMLKSRCKYCFASPMCSVCYAIIWDGEKLSRSKLDQYCSDFRSRTERMLKLFVEMRERHSNFDARMPRVLSEGVEAFSDIEDV